MPNTPHQHRLPNIPRQICGFIASMLSGLSVSTFPWPKGGLKKAGQNIQQMFGVKWNALGSRKVPFKTKISNLLLHPLETVFTATGIYPELSLLLS